MIGKISFGIGSALKNCVEIDAFNGTFLPRNQRTTDHANPRAHGGPSAGYNFLVTDPITNGSIKKDNLFHTFLRQYRRKKPDVIRNLQGYLTKYTGLRLGRTFYAEEASAYLTRMSCGLATFSVDNKHIRTALCSVLEARVHKLLRTLKVIK